MSITELERKLALLLGTFSIPSGRETDYYWLNKNIHTLNNKHRDLKEVKSLLIQILKLKNKERVQTFIKYKK